jgi:excisionase family DNA binding protein
MASWRTLDDAAKQLKISRRTLTRWVSQGLVQTYTILGDRHVYVDMDQIKELRKPRPRGPRQ